MFFVNDDYESFYEAKIVKVKNNIRKGYDSHSKDGKKKTLARNRARNAKFARRPR